MTRRKFIHRSIQAGLAIITGAWLLVSKVAPRKFVRAVKLNKFPGRIKPLKNIETQAKWSG